MLATENLGRRVSGCTDHGHRVVLGHDASLSEVGDARFKIVCQQDVFALDVAVQDGHGLGCVEVGKTIGRTNENLHQNLHAWRIHGVVLLDEVFQRPAADKVHNDEEKRVRGVPDKPDDVDVVDLGQHHDLPAERSEPLFVDEP